jgi:hypothetical protein
VMRPESQNSEVGRRRHDVKDWQTYSSSSSDSSDGSATSSSVSCFLLRVVIVCKDEKNYLCSRKAGSQGWDEVIWSLGGRSCELDKLRGPVELGSLSCLVGGWGARQGTQFRANFGCVGCANQPMMGGYAVTRIAARGSPKVGLVASARDVVRVCCRYTITGQRSGL